MKSFIFAQMSYTMLVMIVDTVISNKTITVNNIPFRQFFPKALRYPI